MSLVASLGGVATPPVIPAESTSSGFPKLIQKVVDFFISIWNFLTCNRCASNKNLHQRLQSTVAVPAEVPITRSSEVVGEILRPRVSKPVRLESEFQRPSASGANISRGERSAFSSARRKHQVGQNFEVAAAGGWAL